jgi:hypothetical protein
MSSLPCTLTELLAASFLGAGAERGRELGLPRGVGTGTLGGFVIEEIPGNI